MGHSSWPEIKIALQFLKEDLDLPSKHGNSNLNSSRNCSNNQIYFCKVCSRSIM